MKYAYWLIHNEICARPGPTEYPWQPAALAAGGIRAVLSVNKGDGVSVRDLRRHGISYKKITLPVTTPPTDRDMPICLKKLPKAYDFARQQINEGNPVLVHCRHGNDRTGLFLVYYLVRAENMGVGEAIGLHPRPPLRDSHRSQLAELRRTARGTANPGRGSLVVIAQT